MDTTIAIEYQLAQFKAAGETITADFGPFRSLRERFKEHSIEYREENIIDDKDVVWIRGGSDGTKVKGVHIPEGVRKPFIMKWRESLKKRKKANE